MPASYAHYRFGKVLLPQLPARQKQLIGRFRRMYDIGLQGPDLFFYFNPFLKTPVGQLGHACHRMTGREFFTQACAAATSEAGRVYLMGLLGHYCLDSACHPFVEDQVAQGKARHLALEGEFDRFLMAMDGIAHPGSYSVAPFLRPTRGESMTIAAFFPPAKGSQVHRSLRFMGLSLKFLAGKNRRRREKLLATLAPPLLDAMVPAEPVEGFQRMDSQLLARFNRCLTAYPGMLEQLLAHLDTGAPLGPEFDPTFG